MNETLLRGTMLPAGRDCLSAYGVAKKNGFTGTEQEWLESLKGPQGDAYVLTKADKEEIAAIVLADMPQGAEVPAYDGSFSKGAL